MRECRRPQRGQRQFAAFALLLPLALLAARPAAAAEPWRLDAALSTPGWLTLTGSQRTRYSRLFNQFRPALGTNDEALSLQTLLHARMDLDPFVLVAELQDSRALLTDKDSAVTPGIVNALEPIQAWFGYRWHGAGSDKPTLDFSAGRQTLDIGSRRFVSRAGFRNAIQSYTGLSARWQHSGGREMVAFYVLPAITQPGFDTLPVDVGPLLDNRIRHDDFDSDLRLWGLYLHEPLTSGASAQVAFYGLRERDDPGERETRDRYLLTQNLRFFRPPQRGRWDFDFDNALQFGHRRATALPADTRRLDVFARYHHLDAGYTFATCWSPRVAVELDVATGDDDPVDDEFGRFDTLFGGGRAEFGPSDFYGMLGRDNLRSIGFRLAVQPSPRSSALLSLRTNWLDARRDVFSRSGVADPSGESGRFAGQQVDTRARYWIVPDLLRWEFGATLFLEGKFMRHAPNATGNGDPVFFYSDILLTF